MHLPTHVTLLASALRANGVTVNRDRAVPPNARGLRLTVDITAVATTPTVDVKVQHADPTSGKSVDIVGASIAQQTGTGTVVLTLHPNLTASANVNVAQPIGAFVRVVSVVGNGAGDSATFSIGLTWLP
jgi:hypothetical protein